MEMIGAHAHLLCKGIEGTENPPSLDNPAGLRDLGCTLLSQGRPVWLATFAGPEAGLIGFFARLVKTDILRSC